MEKSKRENVDQMLEILKDRLRESGVKATHQRMEIFKEVLKSHDHPSAENIYKNIRKRLPTVSLDTVYRTLWLLVDMDILQALGNSRERTRFDANFDKHHHFTCKVCGEVYDFMNDHLNCLNIPSDLPEIGNVERITIEVRGICNNCIQNTTE